MEEKDQDQDIRKYKNKTLIISKDIKEIEWNIIGLRKIENLNYINFQNNVTDD